MYLGVFIHFSFVIINIIDPLLSAHAHLGQTTQGYRGGHLGVVCVFMVDLDMVVLVSQATLDV